MRTRLTFLLLATILTASSPMIHAQQPGPARPSSAEPARAARPLKAHNREHMARYPSEEREQGTESEVKLRLHVSAEGEVSRVDIVESGGERFDVAVIEAVMKWRYEPAQNSDGEAVASTVGPIVYHFRLD